MLLVKLISEVIQFDDPNATISKILTVLKAEEISVDYSISAIKKGSGPACLHILNELSNLVMKKSEFGFSRLVHFIGI